MQGAVVWLKMQERDSENRIQFESEVFEMNKRNVLRAMKRELKSQKGKSAWERGVLTYALELFEELKERVEGGWFTDLDCYKLVEKSLLNGASDWSEYSWGGCSLIYDSDIAERLCTNTELKRTNYGEKDPNRNEQWLDTQARALYQASRRVMRAYKTAI